MSFFEIIGGEHPGPPPHAIASYLRCEHANTRFAWRRHESTTGRVLPKLYGFQCVDCGRYDARPEGVPFTDTRFRWVGEKKCLKYLGRHPHEAVSSHDALTVRAKADWNRRCNEVYQARRAQRSDAWWGWYERYLASREWKVLRHEALKRDGFICQGCHAQGATQVHHRTYERVGYEQLDDLISVCGDCHSLIHGARS